jgi:hypothetical protein
VLCRSNSITVYSVRVDNYNHEIDSINDFYQWHDLTTGHYNDSIRFCKFIPTNDPAILKGQLDSAEAGDTIPVDTSFAKLERVSLRNKGSLNGEWIVILGNPAARTKIALKGVEVAASQKICFVNIDFSDNTDGCGARVVENSASIHFINCSFNHNYQHGFDAVNGKDIYLSDCIFMYNGFDTTYSGISITQYCQDVYAKNILVARNNGYGMYIDKSHVEISQSTITYNVSDGIHYSGKMNEGEISAELSIVCFNKGYGIYRNDEQVYCDVWFLESNGNRFCSNQKGQMGGHRGTIEANGLPVDEKGNDPMFIDPENDNFEINTECELYKNGIGYR